MSQAAGSEYVAVLEVDLLSGHFRPANSTGSERAGLSQFIPIDLYNLYRFIYCTYKAIGMYCNRYIK